MTARYLQNFEVVGELPNGANGICYRVRSDGRDYFAKQLLRPKWVSKSAGLTAKQIRRKQEIATSFVEREQRLATLLAAPRCGGGNIVLPVSAFWHGAHYVKVFPFVRGASGHETVELSEEGLQMFIRSLCLGLASLHEARISHGDLKPENVIARPVPAVDGSQGAVASIIDLEDCYLLDDPPAPNRIGGDEAFMSPELAAYRAGSVDSFDGAASEVYALALVIHLLLSGALPRVGRVRRIMDDDVRAVIGRGPFDTLQSALRFDPADRPTAFDCYRSFAPAASSASEEIPEGAVLRGSMGRGDSRRVIVHMGRSAHSPPPMRGVGDVGA